MLTEIVSHETMPKNNRKMPKGQRFLLGRGKREEGRGIFLLVFQSPIFF